MSRNCRRIDALIGAISRRRRRWVQRTPIALCDALDALDEAVDCPKLLRTVRLVWLQASSIVCPL